MSASAGRVLLIGKGEYDASTQYSPMDWVTYNGSSYVCKQTSTGNVPTNTTYWQLMASKGTDGEVTEAELNTALSGKADKVSGATAGDLAGLDANGNLTDSGVSASDITAIEGKIPSSASSSNKMSTANDITDVYEVMGQNGAKNLLNLVNTTQTINGITFTFNSDGSVTINTVSGGATANTQLSTTISQKFDIGKEYIFSGCAGGAQGTYYLEYQLRKNNANVLVKDIYTQEQKATMPDYDTFLVNILVKMGTVMDNVTLYPMIRLASDTDDTYQPYAMTNRELTEVVTQHTNEPILVATVLANQTWSEQLSLLSTAYNALTDAQKARCFIKTFSNNIFRNNNINTGCFSTFALAGDGNIVLVTTRIDRGTCYRVDLSSTISQTVLTGANNSSTMELYLE